MHLKGVPTRFIVRTQTEHFVEGGNIESTTLLLHYYYYYNSLIALKDTLKEIEGLAGNT